MAMSLPGQRHYSGQQAGWVFVVGQFFRGFASPSRALSPGQSAIALHNAGTRTRVLNFLRLVCGVPH
eukprot:48567-Rhodomonas_salina.7